MSSMAALRETALAHLLASTMVINAVMTHPKECTAEHKPGDDADSTDVESTMDTIDICSDVETEKAMDSSWQALSQRLACAIQNVSDSDDEGADVKQWADIGVRIASTFSRFNDFMDLKASSLDQKSDDDVGSTDVESTMDSLSVLDAIDSCSDSEDEKFIYPPWQALSQRMASALQTISDSDHEGR